MKTRTQLSGKESLFLFDYKKRKTPMGTEAILALLEIAQHAQDWVNLPSSGGLIPPSGGAGPEIPPFGGAGPSGNQYQTPENSPRAVGSGGTSPLTLGSTVHDSPMSQDVPVNDAETAATRSWLRGEFRNAFREEGYSIPSSMATTPSSSLQATPVQPLPAEGSVGPSTPGPKTPELLGRAVKRLFDDKKK
jgi:hypothetical protein